MVAFARPEQAVRCSGEILVSQPVRDVIDTCADCEDIAFDHSRESELKGFAGTNTLYAVAI